MSQIVRICDEKWCQTYWNKNTIMVKYICLLNAIRQKGGRSGETTT